MSWDALYADVAPPEENPTWGDYGQTIKSGGGSALAGAASGLKYLYELGGGEAGNVAKVLDSLQGAGNAISEDALTDMTESGRRRFAAGVTTPEFWEHPFSSLALKATGQIPNVVAMATPMGLFNDARMAVAAVSTVGGTLSSGELLNGFYQKVAEASDETLQKQSPLYREMRERGTEEREARQTYTQTMLGLKPAIAFLFGAADGVLGPVANVVRGVKGGVRHGVAKAARGAAAGEFVEEGGGAVMGQQAEIEGGLREKFDPREALDQALTGAVLGGVLGGASGIGGGKGKAKADEIKAKRQQGAGEEDAAVEATAQGAQVGAAEPVGPAAATITPKSAKGVTVLPDPISPNQAEAEAITDLAQPKPPTVAPAAAPAPPAAAPAPPPTQPVPPPVPPAPAAQEAVQPQQTPPSPLPLGGALAAAPPSQVAPPAAAAPPPAAAAPVTPQVTPSPAAMNAQAAMMPAEALQQPASVTAPVADAGVSAQAAPAAPVTKAAPRTPRVLPSLTAESKTNEVAQQVAQQETATKAAQVIKAADQIDKEPGTKNLSKGDRATIDARAKSAEEIFEKHHVELTMPESPSARREMAAKLQTVLNAAAEQGLVLRENLPDHILKHYSPPKGKKSGDFPITEEERTSYLRSVPTKVGDKAMSAHVRYLRELVGIQKSLLGTKFGPKSKERARVAQFVTEHNTKALDLMGVRRKEEGAAVAEQYQGTVEDAERRQAGAGMKSVDAAGKGVNVSPQSAGPASEGRVLGANEKAVIAAEALARLQQKEADKAAAEGKQAPPPAEPKPEAKPKLSKVEQAKAAAARLADKYAPTSVVKSETEVSGAAPVEISVSEAKTPTETKEEKPTEIVVAEKPQEEKVAEKPAEIPPVAEAPQGQLIGKEAPSTEVTPEVTPERVRLPPTKIEDGTHEGMVPVIKKRNALRKWVNELSDEDYAKVNPDTHRVLVDASSMRTLAMVETDLAQQVGRAPEKPVSTGTIERTPQQRILDAKEAKEAAAEAEALAARAAAAAARKAKAKPMATPEQRKEALAKLLAGKKSEKKALPKRAAQMKQYAEDEMGDLAPPENWEQDLADLAAVDEANAAVVPSDLKVALEARGRLGDIVYTDSASEVLRNLDMSSLGVKTRYLQDFVRRRLTEVLQNVPIYVVDSEVMARVWANDPRGSPPAGYYDTNRRLDGSTVPHIVVDAATLDNPRTFVHVVIHEAMHAALAHKLNTNAKFAEQIEMLREELDWQTKSEPREGFRAAADYAITDVHEFVSEVMSNPDLQYVLANMPLRPKLAQKLGLHNAPMKPWTLWGAFLEKAREVIGFKPAKRVHNFLDEAFKVIAPQLEAVRSEAVQAGTFQQYHAPGTATLRPPPNLSPFDRLTAMLDESRQPMRKMAARIDLAAAGHEVATRAAAAGINTGGKLARAKDKISSLWMMARRNTHLFGPSNMLNRLFEARAFMERAKDTILKKYGGNEASLAIAKAEREHPEAMARAKQTLFDASLHDVNLDGSNDHLGKDKLMGVQAKNEIARLQSEWNNPALDPVRETLRGAIKFFRDIHNAVSRETIKNVLAEANIHDNALVDRIHNGGVTEADKAWMDNKVVSALNEVQSLKRRHGSYVPFRRYGNFVSAAEHELSVPSNATKINDNTLQFVDPTGKGGNARARAAVKGYLRSNSHTPQGNKLTPAQINKVWVDKADPSKILPAEDVNAIPAYRVAMQTQHVEFHETQAEAQRSAADLQQSGLTNARNHAREDAYKNERNIQGAMGTILRSLEKQQRYIDADATQKLAMREMFHDLTLGLSGTTSIKSSMKQRRNVAGMSHDLGRVTSDYARMTANHLAKLQHRPKIDSIFAEMRTYMKDHQYDNDAIRRDEVYKEFINRVYGRAADTAEEHKTGAVTRLLQMSRLSRLAGPSFHIINAHEPWTTSLPMIGGRHGFGAAAKALTDAYNFIGGRAGVTAGLRDTAKAYTNDGGFTDYVKMFKDTIGASRIAGPDKISRMQDMIDYMDARNLYANSAIFEVGKFANPQGNIAGRALDRADLMANQVGSAIEAINRTVTGLTAYNLEYKKNGGNHEAAMHYAYSTAHETMGDYSHWNAAPAFNTGFGRVALQFKKFGHKTYYLLGNTMGNALRGDREAMKQLAGVLVTHGLVAGALGMPTEPFKVALMAANMVGATGFTPDDYEYAVRQLAARLAGQKGGEIISKGLYRGIGIEVSGRMGLDTLLTHGAPKGQKANDIKAFLFDTLAGAPAGYLLDQVAAAQALAKGDVATFVEKASPLRTVGDIAKAYTGATGPKTGPSGKTTQEQFNAWETTVRAVGFTPASVAEHGAMRGTVARESKRLSADRSELINAWIDASGAKKVEAQRAVQEFNSGRPKTEQISQKDLSAAARRRETEKPKTYHGITVSKRTKEIYERAEGVFNP